MPDGIRAVKYKTVDQHNFLNLLLGRTDIFKPMKSINSKHSCSLMWTVFVWVRFLRVVVEDWVLSWSPAVLVLVFKSLWKHYDRKETFLLRSLTELFMIFTSSSGLLSCVLQLEREGVCLAVNSCQKLGIRSVPCFVSNILHCQVSRFFQVWLDWF